MVVTVDPLPADGVTVTVEAEAGLGQVEPDALTVTVDAEAAGPVTVTVEAGPAACVTHTVEILVTPGLFDAERVTVVAEATGQVEPDAFVTVTVEADAAGPVIVTVEAEAAGPVTVTVEAAPAVCETTTVDILVTPEMLAERVTVVAEAMGHVDPDAVVIVTVDADAAGPLAVTVTVEAGPVCVTVEAATEAAEAVTVTVVGAAVISSVTCFKKLDHNFVWNYWVERV